jgi:hypothetical protein
MKRRKEIQARLALPPRRNLRRINARLTKIAFAFARSEPVTASFIETGKHAGFLIPLDEPPYFHHQSVVP